ncbi:uncharacterized protein LOC111083249, partial [Limulus polyphemus]|uniref:Uncharacterized protein LOC111083249 n=1 Tax=Limulus polyphemus TaxID=6850 RepID=A0ABM1RVC9_LIMPO
MRVMNIFESSPSVSSVNSVYPTRTELWIMGNSSSVWRRHLEVMRTYLDRPLWVEIKHCNQTHSDIDTPFEIKIRDTKNSGWRECDLREENKIRFNDTFAIVTSPVFQGTTCLTLYLMSLDYHQDKLELDKKNIIINIKPHRETQQSSSPAPRITPYNTKDRPIYSNIFKGIQASELAEFFYETKNSEKFGVAVLSAAVSSLGKWEMKLHEKWESIASKTGVRAEFPKLSLPGEIDICDEMKRNKDLKTIPFLVGVPPESEVRFRSNVEITEFLVFMSRKNSGLVFTAWRPPKDQNSTLLTGVVASKCDQMFGDNTSVSQFFNILYPLVTDSSGQTVLLEPLTKDMCGEHNDSCNQYNSTLLQPNDPLLLNNDDLTTRNFSVEIYERNVTEVLVRCDGTTNSSLYIDRCGHCVEGLNKSVSHVCGECGGASCLGCDEKPNSRWRLDNCGQCKPPGEGCPFFILNINVIDISEESRCRDTNLHVSNTYQVTSLNCSLQLVEGVQGTPPIHTRTMTSPDNLDFILTEFIIIWSSSPNTTEGVYKMSCLAVLEDNSTVLLHNSGMSPVSVVNLTKWKVTPKGPTSFFAGDKKKVLLQVLEDRPVLPIACFASPSTDTFPVHKISENVYLCDLSVLQKCTTIFIGLGFSKNVENTCNKSTTITVEIRERAPKIKRTYMNEYMRKVVVETDKELKYWRLTCRKLFSSDTVSKYDLQDEDCMVKQNEIHIYIPVHVDLHPRSLRFTFGEENKLQAICSFDLSDQMNGTFTVSRNQIPPKFELLAPDSFCCNIVDLRVVNIMGDGGVGFTFTWTVTKGSTGTDELFRLKEDFHLFNRRSIRVPMNLFRPNETYTFTVRGASQTGLEYLKNKTVWMEMVNLTATIYGPEKVDSLIDNVFTAHIDMNDQWAANCQSLS